MQPAVSLLAGAVLSALLCSSAIAAETSPNADGLTERAARGNLAEPGGARRLAGDQTAALKASLSDKTAKNVILLIGDGMGIPRSPPRATTLKAQAVTSRASTPCR